MLNQIVLVGRVFSEIELKKLSNGKTVANLILAVPKSYKDANGEYKTDFIRVTLWDSIAKNTSEFVTTNDLIGIKGKITCDDAEKNLQVVADKVTFLSSKPREA